MHRRQNKYISAASHLNAVKRYCTGTIMSIWFLVHLLVFKGNRTQKSGILLEASKYWM